VAVVAPAGPPQPDRVEAGLHTLAGWGLDVVRGPHLLDRHPSLPYLAGADADRAADLQAAWCDPDVAAVFCARGGYGSLRTLERLDLDAMAAAPPKIFVGSSDITVLHAVLGERCDLVTLFAPMPATDAFVDDPLSREQLRRTLFEPESQLVLRGPDASVLVGGRAAGRTFGGNLSLLVSRLGVPGATLPPDGAIVLLEDVCEQPYRLDHFLTHLLHAGWFDRVAGIALGSWDQCGGDLVAVRDVMADRLGRLGVPIVWEHGFGHGAGQLTVPLGVEAELDADAGTLTLTEPALAEE
jgi:muramoyltetrapeptide carboxypeptidase